MKTTTSEIALLIKTELSIKMSNNVTKLIPTAMYPYSKEKDPFLVTGNSHYILTSFAQTVFL